MSQAVFPPDVLARIAPDVSLQRHLQQGLRPNLRGFDEFRDLVSLSGGFNQVSANTVVGLATVKHGATHVICGITLGITEINRKDELLSSAQQMFLPVYPIVETVRGRIGAPSDEEMLVSQKLYNYVLHSELIPEAALEITPGYEFRDDESGELVRIYPDTASEDERRLMELSSTVKVSGKRYKYVLYAHLKVFSRSGPLYDVAHFALMEALKNVKIPRVYMADLGIDPTVRVPVRSRGNFGHLSQSQSLFCVDPDLSLATPLAIEKHSLGVASTFGVVDLEGEEPKTVMLADLEGDDEETCAVLKITAVSNGDQFRHVSIVGGGANVTLDDIRSALRISALRAADKLKE